MPDGETRDMMRGSISEARARGAPVIIASSEIEHKIGSEFCIPLIPVHPFLAPLVHVIPFQYIALELAKRLGRNIDRPRNLAKSVTVL
jgi:glucosamine--fructose-6-phosphate aminotransferase (isomerizing)